jgi:hypothetical protein
LFSKLDVNGDGGIDASELSQFVDFASSSTSSTSAASNTGATDLFKSMDADGDGTLSKTERADGAKKLFDELRTQLMSASGATSGAAPTDATTAAAVSTDATSTNAVPADAPQCPPRRAAGITTTGAVAACSRRACAPRPEQRLISRMRSIQMTAP